jgi:hypothetical protein
MSLEKKRSLNDYGYAYFVNTRVEDGQDFGTFSIIPKQKVSGINGQMVNVFVASSGGNMLNGFKVLYCDEMIGDGPAEKNEWFARVLKGSNPPQWFVVDTQENDFDVMEAMEAMGMPKSAGASMNALSAHLRDAKEGYEVGSFF